jgi:hypothetical protein
MRLDDIERALAMHPRDPELWVELAEASWSAHDLETARGAWELAQVLAPRRPHQAEPEGPVGRAEEADLPPALPQPGRR